MAMWWRIPAVKWLVIAIVIALAWWFVDWIVVASKVAMSL